MLCLGQRKPSPLAKVSPGFLENHPHPYIGLFSDLARSPGAFRQPSLGMWQQYDREWRWAFERVRLLDATPREALDAVQAKIQKVYERHEQSVARWAAARKSDEAERQRSDGESPE